MASPLDNLCGPGKALRKEAPDANELAGLKRSGLTRLADAQKQANSVESRFDLGYNAAPALCLAGLATQSIAQRTGTSCSRYFRTHLASVPRCGGYSPGAMTSEIAESTKAISLSTSGSLPT